MALKIVVQHTFADILELNRAIPRVRHGGYLAAGLGITGCLIAAYLFATGDAHKAMVIFPWGLFFLLLGLLAPRIAAIGAWFLKTEKHPGLLEVCSEEGFTMTVRGEQLLLPWNVFKPYFETQNLLVIPFRHLQDALTIPKRCCSEEEFQELRELLRRTVGER